MHGIAHLMHCCMCVHIQTRAVMSAYGLANSLPSEGKYDSKVWVLPGEGSSATGNFSMQVRIAKMLYNITDAHHSFVLSWHWLSLLQSGPTSTGPLKTCAGDTCVAHNHTPSMITTVNGSMSLSMAGSGFRDVLGWLSLLQSEQPETFICGQRRGWQEAVLFRDWWLHLHLRL